MASISVITRICALTALLAALTASPAFALSFIRDAEIEATLHRIADPIFRAASLNPGSVDLYIVNDPEMNAFVAGGQNIFIHSGMLTKLDSIDQLRAVIAHETGHITGGHLARRDSGTASARNLAIFGMIGAAAVAVAGSPDAGVAIAAGSQQLATRNMLAYSRGEEASADQAGLRYMAAAGGDPEAIIEVLRMFEGQEALLAAQMDPYAQTHPMSSDRIAMLEQRAAKYPKPPPPDSSDVYWYNRMVAKLEAFLASPRQTLRKYPPVDTSEMAALSRAIAYHREPDISRGVAQMNALVALRPEDPFYLELKGQFLLESGHAEAAVKAYRAAAIEAPKQALILGGLGRALLNTDDPNNNPEARDVLRRSVALDRQNPDVLRDLAFAEARLGNEGAAALATAERYMLVGDPRDTLRSAEYAAARLPVGSPGWRRAEDMITMARRAINK